MKTASSIQGRPEPSSPVGVIDIGSNSVRLQIFDKVSRNPMLLFNEKNQCGLGRSLASTGELAQDAVDEALKTLRRFRALAVQRGVTKIHAIATAAARDAKNAEDFVSRATDILAGPIAILSGKDEAKLAGYGVIAGFHEPDGLSGDMGGGSLEITDIKKFKIGKMVTTPLGALRVIDISKGNIEKAKKYIDEELQNISWLKQGKDRPFYAVGGTWRAIAKLHMAQRNYPMKITHGYRIRAPKVIEFTQLLDGLSPSSMDGIQLVNKSRRETVPFGALVLERLFQMVEPSELVISATGVREGLIYGLLSKEEQKTDPLLAACADLARLDTHSSHYCQELCDWTDMIFANFDLDETPEETRLRHAACLLSDVARYVHTEYRVERGLDLVAEANMTGVNHADRIFLALSVYFRYGGSADNESAPLLSLAGERVLERTRILGAAFRLANLISAGTAGVIYNTPVHRKGKKLVVDLGPPYNMLDGDRVRRRAESLASLLNCEAYIDTEGAIAPIDLVRA